MQKKLIAAAIAAVASTGAFAQVTMYGIVDLGGAMGTTKASGVDAKFAGVTGGNLSGSRLGFKAEEDLGGGMAAIADITLGTLNLDSTQNNSNSTTTKAVGSFGNNITSTRQSYLGLKTTSGTIVAGRLQTSGFDYTGADIMGGSAFDPIGNFAGSGTQINTVSRVNNAVGYMNTFGPVSVKIARAQTVENPTLAIDQANNTQTSNSGSAAAGVRTAVTNLGVTFNQGPIRADLVYIKVDDANAFGGTTDLGLAGYYDLGVAKVGLNYIQTQNDTKGAKTATALSGDFKATLIGFGATVPVGKGKIDVAYATQKTDLSGDKKASGFGIDYQHALGKRTTAYVGYFKGTSGNVIQVDGVAGRADKESAPGAATSVSGGTASTFAVGGRLTF